MLLSLSVPLSSGRHTRRTVLIESLLGHDVGEDLDPQIVQTADAFIVWMVEEEVSLVREL